MLVMQGEDAINTKGSFSRKGRRKKKKKILSRFFLNFTGTQIGETTTCVIIIEERRIGETRVV